MTAPATRPPLDDTSFDVAIIGGGINGVAIARECARAGLRTLIVEQNDFASGTTSRSTRIIHGGLRYLEHGEIALVRESVRERQRLMTERPHLVRPMQFVLALPPGRRSAFQVRFGLWLYRKYARTRTTTDKTSPAVSLEKLLERDGDGLRLFQYEDAQCEFPERLVAEWLAEAMAASAVARNHTQALEVETAHGKVRGVRLRDLLTGAEYRVTAARVVNATGPWADAMCRQSGVSTRQPMIGGVRGSHIVLPRFPGAPESALYTEATDGRPVFLLPWNGQVLFGTTEVRDDGDPASAKPSGDEVRYLFDSLRRLMPRVSLPDINFAFAGIRPLPYAPDEKEAAVSRRHFLRDHKADGADGLISIIGGKLTTAASLARECVRALGRTVPEPSLTAVADFGDMDTAHAGAVRRLEELTGLGPSFCIRLLAWHGERAGVVAELIARSPSLREPIADGIHHTAGEALYSVQEEAAVTLGDILLRRVPVALTAEWTDEQTRQAARRIGTLLGWREERIDKEIGDFEAERSAFLLRAPASALA